MVLLSQVPISAGIYTQFTEFILKKYKKLDSSEFTLEEKQDEFEKIFLLGLNLAKKLKDTKNYLIFNEKPARKDVIEKLGHILYQTQQLETYPKLRPLQLKSSINKVLRGKDKRTTDKYLKCILQHSNSVTGFNVIDMTQISLLIPTEFVIEGGILW